MLQSNVADSKCATLSVATWNLLNFIEPPNAAYELYNILSAEEWQKKCAWVDAYVEDSLPDVIGFQEIFSIDALAERLAPYGYTLVAVDTPRCQHGYIYDSPVVGIASRLPIISVKPLMVSAELIAQMGLAADFSFSRTPVVAEVMHPDFGMITFVVVHFKSRRAAPLTDNNAHNSVMQKEPAEKFAGKDLLAHQVRLGEWASVIQRGSEANCVVDFIAHRQVEHTNTLTQPFHPMVVLGDFNEPLDCSTFRGINSTDILTDSWDLYRQLNVNTQCVRPPTHYYANKGSVLDYILVNAAFDHASPLGIATVTQYSCYDRHLINPIFALDSASTDHAIVKITIEQPRISDEYRHNAREVGR
ncbi:endonuclease/exonuclease/phosphatase family protein [Thaumasiovibrio sp. DFM-14]|uniref:endonuclease/exonuclease/phosphatase family protein n=1 Tax=Thaumasiovibrio sp. DFM-14 TaxID=3384792 RepID=UPI0039A279B0